MASYSSSYNSGLLSELTSYLQLKFESNINDLFAVKAEKQDPESKLVYSELHVKLSKISDLVVYLVKEPRSQNIEVSVAVLFENGIQSDEKSIGVYNVTESNFISSVNKIFDELIKVEFSVADLLDVN